MLRHLVKYSVFYLLLLLNTSCAIVNSMKSGYVKNNPDDFMVEYSGDLDSLVYDGKVYVITMEQLKEHLAKHDTSLVYAWSPYCHGSACCYPPMFEDYCKNHNLHPVVWTTYIREETLPAVGTLTAPIVFIDPKMTGLNLYPSYSGKLIRRLTQQKGEWHRFCKFKGNQFQGYMEHL